MTELETDPCTPCAAPLGVLGPFPASQPAAGVCAPFERLAPPLREAIALRGYSELTSVQAAVLDPEAEGRDLQISSQTGSGKTLAVGLVVAPALLADASAERSAGPAVLVIAPTRELAMQLKGELAWLFARVPDVRVDCVTGGTDKWGERGRLARGPRILIGTPGRLLDHLTDGVLDLSGVRELVLDEADQMLDMGFREELEAILDATPAQRRTHLVSATFPDGILRLAERYQTAPFAVQGTRRGVANADIEHVAHLVDAQSRYAVLVNLLLLAEGERTLVFANTRAETGRIAEQLTADGIAALPLSGELAQAQRTRTLAAFRDGAASVLVATDVAARGLDVPDCALVIHAAPAMDAEVYTHRSGRTGRAGRKGRSVVLAPVRNERGLRRVLREAGVDAAWCPAPGAGEVGRALGERARGRVHAAIERGVDSDPLDPAQTERRRELARDLLSAHDPEHVVLVLLEHSRLASTARPREVELFEPRFASRGPHHHAASCPAGEAPAPSTRVRYSINWGTRAGATPKRILAHVCRRGGITSQVVGAIRLESHASTFEIGGHVAPGFEARVQHKDARDPNLWISRVEAAAG